MTDAGSLAYGTRDLVEALATTRAPKAPKVRLLPATLSAGAARPHRAAHPDRSGGNRLEPL
ncbi:hypothetical protein [Actinocrispum wychmicini]|uniref:Uncharacterized protein n=1 Tax=Actinocrispum wychmicini TaxID=1213861 RepID=A0A4R2JBD0_9PSEU|nr:hypothetical protein [Actinocrispum wychmicini]TCO55677.1 hypothetical protein EV192_10799 [Actinocrispum wychmicini]